MTECEFKNLCDSIGYTHPCEKDKKEIAYCAVRITLNSPQFKKQYAKLPEDGKNPYHDHAKGCSDGAACEFCAYEIGRYRPDPKQYAKREELVEEIRSCGLTVEQVVDDYMDDQIEVVTMNWLLDRIRTHGLEE